MSNFKKQSQFAFYPYFLTFEIAEKSYLCWKYPINEVQFFLSP